jgi:hypothetical protein
MITIPRWISYLACALLVVAVTSTVAAAQEPKSVALAKQLAAALDAAKLDAIAAKDGADAESYVAALYFPGSQLLVVAAKYAPAVLIKEKLEKKDYREIYIDLNSAAVAGSRVMFEDMGADGLLSEHPENKAFDSFEIGGTRTVLDDDWRKTQKIQADAFAKTYAAGEAIYERLLTALLAQVKK